MHDFFNYCVRVCVCVTLQYQCTYRHGCSLAGQSQVETEEDEGSGGNLSVGKVRSLLYTSSPFPNDKHLSLFTSPPPPPSFFFIHPSSLSVPLFLWMSGDIPVG